MLTNGQNSNHFLMVSDSFSACYSHFSHFNTHNFAELPQFVPRLCLKHCICIHMSMASLFLISFQASLFQTSISGGFGVINCQGHSLFSEQMDLCSLLKKSLDVRCYLDLKKKSPRKKGHVYPGGCWKDRVLSTLCSPYRGLAVV